MGDLPINHKPTIKENQREANRSTHQSPLDPKDQSAVEAEREERRGIRGAATHVYKFTEGDDDEGLDLDGEEATLARANRGRCIWATSVMYVLAKDRKE